MSLPQDDKCGDQDKSPPVGGRAQSFNFFFFSSSLLATPAAGGDEEGTST